jgi:hypothetical protein
MDGHMEHHHGQAERRFTIPSWVAVGAALFGLGVLASACSSGPSSPGVASLGGNNTTTTDPTGGGSSGPTAAQQAQLLDYSKCMQTHGIKDFPDPSSNGTLSISAGTGSDLNPNDPLFESAQKVCQKLMPQPTKAQLAQNIKHELAMSNCMRAHGIKDFPDPSSNGSIQINAGAGSDLNPNDPLFQSAQNACQKYLPGKGKGGFRIGEKVSGPGPGGPSGSGSSGQVTSG